MINYLDPYKDDPYGKIKGSKNDSWFKVNFSEAKIYPTDSGYILAGYVSEYLGVTRAFKSSEPLSPGLCTIPIYNKEYEVREKDKDGNWQSVTYQPSKTEVIISRIISSQKAEIVGETLGVKASVCFLPDAQIASYSDTEAMEFIKGCNSFASISPTGNLPKYTVPDKSSKKAGTWGASKVSLAEKMDFIKQELVLSLGSSELSEQLPLSDLMTKFYVLHQGDMQFIELYFEVLTSVVR